MKKTAITQLLNIKYPIIQGGMVWVSGHKLASAVSEAGGLGTIGAGSMHLELLEHHLTKALQATKKPLAINIPLLYKDSEKQIELALKMGIKIFITSAGSPKKFTNYLQQHGAIVGHVCSTPELALKCEQAGVDFVIVEGHEAGGHNGRDELTTMVLVPQTKSLVSCPVIAAGGIANGAAIVAALALGADGVQMGSRFVMTQESSAHPNFKHSIQSASSRATTLCMKDLVPVRLLHNQFYEDIKSIELSPLSLEERQKKLQEKLGKGRAKAGMLDGDVIEGELEIGQIAGLLNDIPTVAELFTQLTDQYRQTIKNLI